MMARINDDKNGASGRHHATLGDLEAAARNQCGICHILSGQLDWQLNGLADMYAKDPLRYRFGGSASWNGEATWVGFPGMGSECITTLSWKSAFSVALDYHSRVTAGDKSHDGEYIPANEEIQRLRLTATNTGDSPVLELGMSWLQNCEHNHHNKCQRKHSNSLGNSGSKENWFPDRILDLTGEDPRLLITSEEIPIHSKYATLSHCWGPNPKHLTLTSENIKEFRRKIPMSTMQKTFRDAVEIARTLEIFYIWIDSLCIIQSGEKSKEDWEKQASALHEIYSNCALNISADHANNADEGCFIERDMEVVTSAYFKKEVEGGVVLDHIFVEEDMYAKIFKTPLAQRG